MIIVQWQALTPSIAFKMSLPAQLILAQFHRICIQIPHENNPLREFGFGSKFKFGSEFGSGLNPFSEKKKHRCIVFNKF